MRGVILSLIAVVLSDCPAPPVEKAERLPALEMGSRNLLPERANRMLLDLR
jgi:hypothetical protein